MSLNRFAKLLTACDSELFCAGFDARIIYAFGMLFVVFAGIDSARRFHFVAFAFVCFLMLEKVFF